mmetsp:Transcript_18819/g.30912  ORF Transcript_18819/g.30912 Transcript_18819/m.30912 type:complete len:280 (+) Transcript_18819:69-908(+)|eukprot:CAMPEP_0184643966 /NCGR_PEP_ID=MMETSP0308-20130426/763_1 /TAXON_ID=38269 /ORGANISM="Gloeochaete witrockiana, Strain SAG 46.84" /LENGTH=279 /DNA_ID=CAMNT_0027072243 /DNA_START=30 /DNA_END=869 /DNA_ORIENTATION=+
MGYDPEIFLANVEEVLSDFICCICRGICEEIVVTPCCKTLFCYACVLQAIEGNGKCPVDRSDLRGQGWNPEADFVLNRVLNRQKVKCVRSCGWTGELSNLSEHARICLQNPSAAAPDPQIQPTTAPTNPSAPNVSPSALTNAMTALQLMPTVMWVDDNPQWIERELEMIQDHVRVVQKTSTTEAIRFLEANPAFKDAPPLQFRVITDRSRMEASRLNDDAARNLISWMRTHDGWANTPILVFCGKASSAAPLTREFQHVKVTDHSSEAITFGILGPNIE